MRLAHELDRAAEDAVANEEQPEHRARPRQRVKFMGGDAQDDEQHDAFEKRLIELARMARLIARAGNTIAQGTSLTRPTTSALMKLAIRPKNSPMGPLPRQCRRATAD